MSNPHSERLKEHFGKSRTFLFALAIVFIVWIVSNMSEQKVYRENYRVVYDGIDSLSYTMMQQDSIVVLDITSNGFHAVSRSVGKKRIVHIDVTQQTREWTDSSSQKAELNLSVLLPKISEQIDMRGVSSVQTVGSSLKFSVAWRERRGFVVDIDSVKFEFNGLNGICGVPTVSPDTVWLYGSKKSLDKIDGLKAKKQTISNIQSSGNYKVALSPVWKRYPDLKVSASKVNVYLPVDEYIEKTFMLPIQISDSDKQHNIQTYPTQATVRFMVLHKDYAKIVPEDFKIIALRENDSASHLHIVVDKFPTNVRITSIYPEEVQYITIIK